MLVPSSNLGIKFVPNSFIGLALLVALFLRVAAAGGELWLDEIWSLEIAQQLDSPLDLIVGVKHDNNHPLNTAYLAAVGPGQPGWIYRFPSIIAGTLAVALGGLISRRWGPTGSLTTMTLLATSYVMIHYTSEARGYAMLLLFVLGALESLLRVIEQGGWRWIGCFWFCCVAGFTAHPLFVQFWLPAMVWSLLVKQKEKLPARSTGTPYDDQPDRGDSENRRHDNSSVRGRSSEWMGIFRWAIAVHGIPLGYGIVLYGTYWRGVELGGGPKYILAAKLAESMSLVIGGPTHGWGAYAGAAIAVLAFAMGIWLARGGNPDTREGVSSRFGSLLALVILAPVVQAVALHPPFLFVRYFLISILLALFALSILLASLYQWGARGRVIYVMLMLAFLAANTWQTAWLVRVGRGQYLAALNHMSTATSEPIVTISSDHNFGINKLVEFYGPRVNPPRHFQYFKGQSWPPEGPRWLVLHREADGNAPPPETTLLIDGHHFDLDRVSDCAPLSGWQWACYRRAL